MPSRNSRNCLKEPWIISQTFVILLFITMLGTSGAWARFGAPSQATPATTPPPANSSGANDAPEPADVSRAAAIAASVDVLLEPSRLDFGVLAPNQPASGLVILSNLGQSPLRITSVRPKCTCTTHQLSADTIEPGKHETLTVTMGGRTEVGPRASAIYVFFAGEADPHVIDLRYDVARAVRPTPARLEAERVLDGVFAIEATDARPFRVLSSNGGAPQFVGFDPERDEPRASYTLKWNLTDVICERMRDWWVVETDHPDAPIVEVRIMNRCTQLEARKGRDWRLSPSLVVLEHMRAGEWTEFTLSLEMLRPSAPVASIDNVVAEAGLFEVEAISGSSAGQWRGRIRPTSTSSVAPAVLYGTLRFFSGPHSMPIDVVARVGQEGGQ